MKFSELKKIVTELNKEVLLETGSVDIISLAANLSEIIGRFNQEEDVGTELMHQIEEVICEFWRLVSNTLPYEKWQNSNQVAPWIIFQRSLYKAGVLPADFHHPILYQHLKSQYENVGNSPLGIDKLMPLLICCSRMTGYANKDPQELSNYPYSQLNKQIEAKRPQELTKLKDILCLLRSSFYLIYHFCTVEQLTLIPYLIYFRNSTTDEERRSELAIFNWLTKKTTGCLDFFSANEDYIDTRSFKQISALEQVCHLIPAARKNFIKETNEDRWIYLFIQKSRTETLNSRHDLLNYTVRLFDADFASETDKSYPSALKFAINILKTQTIILTKKESKIVHDALYYFCLDKYKVHRKEDPRPRFSPISPSGQTKCEAAEKIQLGIQGIPVQFSFFQRIALMDGRLKTLIDTFKTKFAY